ncbi:hypothetical protein T492DRAFT_913128 [Pavlovales sp. CCMP2436]|nr:hypothetical protein T492DRAFT_913128 [Pavlovales sp. CCMP2436]
MRPLNGAMVLAQPWSKGHPCLDQSSPKARYCGKDTGVDLTRFSPLPFSTPFSTLFSALAAAVADTDIMGDEAPRTGGGGEPSTPPPRPRAGEPSTPRTPIECPYDGFALDGEGGGGLSAGGGLGGGGAAAPMDTCRTAEAITLPGPARPELARPEPARPEPARPEPARLEPARPEPARPVPPPSPSAPALRPRALPDSCAHSCPPPSRLRPYLQMHSLAIVLLASALAAPVPRRLDENPPVDLGTAGDFVILTKSGISTVPASVIVGDIGVSPITFEAMTGFSMIADSSNTFSTSAQLTGKAFGADQTSPTPSKLTIAIGDMETAYTDAASRPTSSGANLNVLAGLITGTTFTPGVYTWGSDVAFSSDIYLSGSADDIFIFQTSGNVVVGAGAKVLLIPDGSGGGTPTAATIVWQVAGYLKVDAGAHLEGIFLIKTHAAFEAKSSLNGRILAQTAATLISTTIIEPAALSGAQNATIGTD